MCLLASLDVKAAAIRPEYAERLTGRGFELAQISSAVAIRIREFHVGIEFAVAVGIFYSIDLVLSENDNAVLD